MLLTGTYHRSLDEKLRLAIPKPLREQLSVKDPLYLAPGMDGCLALYPTAAFAALADRLAGSSPAAQEVRSYSRLFFSQASPISLDSQWRFRAPVDLVKWAGLAAEVIIVGVRDHIEIWSSDRWQEYMARCDGNYEKLAELAFRGASNSAPAGAPTAGEPAGAGTAVARPSLPR